MNSEKTKIAIFGAGSIGCFLGGLLRAQGCDVVFIGRERLQTAVRENGLTLTHYERPKIYLPPEIVRIETQASCLSEVNLILLCTKSQDTERAAQLMSEYANPDCQIISCQNGISNVPLLKHYLNEKVARISGAIISFNVTPIRPGAYHCGTGGVLHFEHELPKGVVDAFQKAQQEIKTGGNFVGDQWAKLLVNLNNALNTLSGGTLREGLLQRDYRRALALIVKEGLSIAKAHQIDVGEFNGRKPDVLVKTLRLPNWAYKIVMQFIVKIDAKARSSMLDDLESGRISEVDYLQGEIVRHAQAIDMDAPYNRAILKAVHTTFETQKSPKLSGTEILNLMGLHN